MKESAVQKKVTDFLEGKGWHVIKVITANKAGWADLICCSPKGRFVAIEVKTEGGNITKLQALKLQLICDNNGVAGVVYGWDDFLTYYEQSLKGV